MEEQVYEDRGATSWESRMYSNNSIRLDNYNTRKSYPENIQEIENRGSTGWEVLMMQKSSFLPTGRHIGANRSINTEYSSRTKGVVKKPIFK
tara:strand:+ start:1590 stop:1865 length:276 start_codon:yes stop_codon:yes gene_type:complete